MEKEERWRAMAAHENPFASRYIEPGAIEYSFLGRSSIEEIAKDFSERHGRRAAIVGPHGSGKSTLLHSLAPSLGHIEHYCDLANPGSDRHSKPRPSSAHPKATEPRVRWFRLSSDGRDYRQVWSDRKHWCEQTIVIIDGFEQLPFWFRWAVRWETRRRGAGLLVTTHADPIGLSVLWRTTVTEQSAEYVLRQLLRDQPYDVDRLMQSPQWQSIRSKWNDNLREALFDLYDLVEDNRMPQ
jgi:energy-coupling factor transporter ATP-binding protein EcfA2